MDISKFKTSIWKFKTSIPSLVFMMTHAQPLLIHHSQGKNGFPFWLTSPVWGFQYDEAVKGKKSKNTCYPTTPTSVLGIMHIATPYPPNPNTNFNLFKRNHAGNHDLNFCQDLPQPCSSSICISVHILYSIIYHEYMKLVDCFFWEVKRSHLVTLLHTPFTL